MILLLFFSKMTPSTVHQYISGGKERNAVIEAKAKRAIKSSIYVEVRVGNLSTLGHSSQVIFDDRVRCIG